MRVGLGRSPDMTRTVKLEDGLLVVLRDEGWSTMDFFSGDRGDRRWECVPHRGIPHSTWPRHSFCPRRFIFTS